MTYEHLSQITGRANVTPNSSIIETVFGVTRVLYDITPECFQATYYYNETPNTEQ